MNLPRRNILRGSVSTALLSVAAAAGLLRPSHSAASSIKNNLPEVLRTLQHSNSTLSNAIRIQAPDIAVDGGAVFIDIACALPDVDTLLVYVDTNPQPLVAAFQLTPQVPPDMQMRIKLSRTGQIWVVARSAGQFYKMSKPVTVTVGGCGVGLN
jgi:sulfur-oxidizing protein SoxY